MYQRVRSVTEAVSRQLRDLKTIGVISAYLYKRAVRNPEVANKLIKKHKKYNVGKLNRNEIQELKSKLRNISKQLEVSKATHTWRKRLAGRAITSGINTSAFTGIGSGSITFLEAAMANLRYFDPGTNALVTAAPTSGTYEREIYVKSSVYSLRVANNYQVPCEVRLYALRPKIDTNIAPATAFTNGLTDQLAPSATSCLVYPTDSQQFNDVWRIEKSMVKRLQPGQVMDMSFAIKPFQYDFAFADAHASDYQPKMNGFFWGIRVEGPLGHDTTADEQGTLQAGVDWFADEKYVFEYDAGKDLNDFYVTDGSNTFTNGGVVSSKPVSDNLGYSVA